MLRALRVEGTLRHFFCLALPVRAQSDHVVLRRSRHQRRRYLGEAKTRLPEWEWEEGREPGSDATGVPQPEDLGGPCGCDRRRPCRCSFRQAAPAVGGVDVPRKRGPGRPKGSKKKAATDAAVAPSPARRRGRPPGSKNKKTLAAFVATASGSGGLGAGASSPARPSQFRPTLPALQPLVYTSAEGWSTFIVPVLAGAKDRLRLPSQFVEAMEGQEMAYATLWECSVG
jgi:hypothetical protein